MKLLVVVLILCFTVSGFAQTKKVKEKPAVKAEQKKQRVKPKKTPSEQKYQFAQLGSIGAFTTKSADFGQTPLAAGYDFLMNMRYLMLRAGLYGWTISEKNETSEVRFNVFTLDVGLDYLFLNSNFVLGAGARAGYSVPTVKFTVDDKSVAFAGKSGFSSAIELFAHYAFDMGYIFGVDLRLPFYSGDLGLKNSTYYLLSFGKKF